MVEQLLFRYLDFGLEIDEFDSILVEVNELSNGPKGVVVTYT